MTSKVNGGIRGKVRETSKLGQLQKYRTQQAQIRRSKILGGVDPRRGGRANPLNWSSRASRAFNDSRISGQFGNRATQMGDALAKEEFEKQVKEASISQDGVSLNELQVIATTGAGSDGRKVSEATRAAAIDKVMSTGGFNQRRDVLEAMASNKSTTSRTLRSRAVSAAYAKGDANIYGTQFGDNIVQETGTINSANDLANAAVANIAGGSLSAEHAVQGEGSTKYLVDTVVTKANAGDTIAQTARLRFKDVSSRAKVAESTRSKVTSAIDDAFTKL